MKISELQEGDKVKMSGSRAVWEVVRKDSIGGALLRDANGRFSYQSYKSHRHFELVSKPVVAQNEGNAQ